MWRQTRRHRRRNILPVETDTRTRRRIGFHRVDENDRIGGVDVWKQRQAKRAAVQHMHVFRRHVPIEQRPHCRRSDAVVFEQHVAEAKDQQRRALIHRPDLAD